MFASLFAVRPRYRCYARVDAAGLCQAFYQAGCAPPACDWIEVTECRLSWLQRPLPAEARLQNRLPSAPGTPTQQPLSA